MLVNLIIDGNYILSRLTFSLHKNNLLYGALETSLENAISNYKRWYPFARVFLVSDSKEPSWRKKELKDYKGTRKKDTNIDWKFVYETYDNFKKNIKGAKVLESPNVEGDDWISFLVHLCNRKNESTMIISNDYDIKQLMSYSLDPLWINIMVNEMFNKEKLFMPEGWKTFIHKVKSLPSDDIFNLNNNDEFLKLMDRFINKSTIQEVDPIRELMVKVISGDKSDNISSVWSTIGKNGKRRGIGEKGANTIYEKYLEEFGEVNLNDPDLKENFADVICEKKKISKIEMEPIIENMEENFKFIDLRLGKLPTDIKEKMKLVWKNGKGKNN